MTEEQLWDVAWSLSCGHHTPVQRLTNREFEAATPRRADGNFGATVCPQGCGRRRVVMSSASRPGPWTGRWDKT